MDIRFVLAVLIVIEDFCGNTGGGEQDSGEGGIAGDERENFEAFDWEGPRKQVSDLIDRLAWCPPMHRHFDEVVRENGEYSVLSMAARDAERVKNWLYDVQNGSDDDSCGGKGKEKVREIQR